MEILDLILGNTCQMDVQFIKQELEDFNVAVEDIDFEIEVSAIHFINACIQSIYEVAVHNACEELGIDYDDIDEYVSYEVNASASDLYIDGESMYDYDELIEALKSYADPSSGEREALREALEKAGFKFHSSEEDEYVEFAMHTQGGVEMTFTVIREEFNLETVKTAFEELDIDEEIEHHRQDKRYKERFSIRESLEDFEAFKEKIIGIIANIKEGLE